MKTWTVFVSHLGHQAIEGLGPPPEGAGIRAFKTHVYADSPAQARAKAIQKADDRRIMPVMILAVLPEFV